MNASDPSLERTFRGHSAPVSCVAFAPDLKQCATGSEDCNLIIWNFKPQLRAHKFAGHKVTPCAKCIALLTRQQSAICSIDFAPNGRQIATASVDRTVRLWEPKLTGKCDLLRGHAGAVRSVRFAKNGHYLITGSDDKTAKVWHMPQKRFCCTLSGHSNWVRAARFNEDAKLAITSSDDKTVKLWDVQEHHCLETFYDHSGEVLDVQFHPDNSVIASGSTDQSIKLWDIRARTLIQHYDAHTAPVTSVSFHASGNYLLSTSLDSTIKIWDIREGHLLYTLHGHRSGVTCGAFSECGKFFATGAEDDLVMVWRSNFDRDDEPQQHEQQQQQHAQKQQAMKQQPRPSRGTQRPQTAPSRRLDDSTPIAVNTAKARTPRPLSVHTGQTSNDEQQHQSLLPAAKSRTSEAFGGQARRKHGSTPSPAARAVPQPPSPLQPSKSKLERATTPPKTHRSGDIGVRVVSEQPDILQDILHQMELITRTLSAFDQRLTMLEEHVHGQSQHSDSL